MSKRDVQANRSPKTTQPTGLSLQGSQINLSTRLSNFNISNPLQYLYNENVDSTSRGRPMSASTLSATYQESPRRSKLAKRPQSADTVNKIAKSRQIAFNFSDQQNDLGLENGCAGLETTFDELDADELSLDERSSPAPLLQDALEPGLTSKPPIPPAGSGPAETSCDRDAADCRKTGAAVTFDDAIELKFQRWFPNSVPVAPAAVPRETVADVSLNGVSYEYSERVIDNDRGTVTYTRSSSSMSIRGSQDQLDEEHLYSNLSAAIGGADKLCRGVVSADVLDMLHQNDDNRRGRAPTRPKPKKKISVPVAAAAVAYRAKRDTTKSVLKPRTNLAAANPVPVTTVTCDTVQCDGLTARHEQRAPDKEARKDHHQTRKLDDSPVDYATEDVVSWMSSHQLRPSTSELDDPFASRVDDKHCDALRRDHDHKTSTYDEIVNILKELESENNDIDMNVRKSAVTDNNKRQTLVPEPSSSSKALWSFLDEVEKNSNRSTPSKLPKQKLPVNLPSTPPSSPEKIMIDVKKGNLQQVIELGKTELAQKVASLQMQLAEKEDVTEKLKTTVSELQAEHAKSKAEYESTVTRHQKFIDKLLNEKKELSESCASTVKELTKKMNDALASQEERHKVELKKAIDKQTASEKIKKDRWVDLKTKKIKEMTIKGIEPELNRMSTAYQEELSELRRIHQSQIEEIEGTWHRRMAAMRDKMDTEREQAIITERENSRNRLEMEIAELEKSYQEQRKRLLGEIHGERLRQERENDIALMEKQRALEQKFEKLVAELQDKIHKKEEEFQNELKNIRETYESEKTKWINHQTTVLAEKENTIREMCKKERDKHIELVVQKLENEASERENTSEAKIKRIKSEYEADIHELENTISGYRLKLNEARTKAQEQDDKITELTSELNKCHNEEKRLKDVICKLKDDLIAKENTIKAETLTKVGILQTELTQSKLNFQTRIKTIESEKEKEINHVYVRVKEAIKRKDEIIQVLQSERDAALDQCSNIEKLMERQRKELLKLK
ncbi:centrosomal protein of 131 kDa-like isoform X2 [Sipha flava]|uniref:Centrosomal protein of 131 kDa-like isoform X2 n=1 Tax=Sipha flava TaxID=143950 RepID=A0A8B8GHT6_9HEMI|nr:centrosomal protein of 131 kDa-like isoform X2 [Sipha flava]